MKKNLLLGLSFVLVVLVACGPAAENRDKMHTRAKEFQDSIATVIRQSMQQAEMPAQTMPAATPPATAMPAQNVAPAQH